MESLYLFGISTTSTRIKSFIEYHSLYNLKAFIVDDAYKKINTYEGYPVFSLSEFKSLRDYKRLPIFICLAWNNLNNDRKLLYERALAERLNIINIISPCSIIRGKVVGRNIFVGDYVGMEVGSVINENVFIDHHSFIGTNTVIHKHSYIGAKSMIAGNCCVNEQSFIGIHATIFDQVRIGRKCIISGGQVVKRNIQNFAVVKELKGNQLVKEYNEMEIINLLKADNNVR